MYVLTLAGQSNAIGCGHPLPTVTDNAGLFQLAQTGPHTGELIALSEPLAGPDADGTEGVGPGPQVARRLRDMTGEWVCIVPVAYGGTGLVHGRWHPREGDLYIRAVEQTRKALQIGDTHYAGLLWVQGEHDSLNPQVTADDYRYWLNTLIANFREDTQMLAAPVVIGSMVPSWINGGRSGKAPEIHQVHAAMHASHATPKGRRTVAFAQGPDGPGQDQDGIHYTAVQARELGDRMFEQLRVLLEQSGSAQQSDGSFLP